MPTIEEALDRAERSIKRSKAVDLWRPSDARVNAEELLSKVLGREVKGRDLDRPLTRGESGSFERLVTRRVLGEPIALILGEIDFKGLKLKVVKGTFIPRHSSELLATKAISRLARMSGPIGVDVATGTGPVALAVAHRVRRAQVYGLDIWTPSLRVAKDNAKRLGIRNVTFIRSDMLSALPRRFRGKVGVFTIHPPYVARRYVRTLPKEVREFEPHVSLTDQSTDGLGLVRRLTEEAPAWLRPGGWTMVEVSPDLSRRVRGIFIRAGFADVRSEKDSLGATRVVSGRLR